MNITLFRKIRKHILEEPKRINLNHWVDPYSEVAPCGTEGCIAGWACVLGIPQASPIEICEDPLINFSSMARALLGISPGQEVGLFSPNAYTRATPHTLSYAKAVVRKMNKFVKRYYPDQYNDWLRKD